MELWRQCAHWLIQCRVLPPSHRVTWSTAQVCDLAQALRDGVLLCQLLNNLLPHAVNLKEINLRPQMSQFLCLKNIRTFLSTCCEKFGLRKNELFEPFDLFEVRDFGKVIDALSILSWTQLAQSKGIIPFPTEESIGDDEVYNGLSDQIDETVEEDDDLYDCVETDENEGDDIYEDLMKTEVAVLPQKMTELDKRNCCLQEIWQTEQKYTSTLESIYLYFMKPLQRFLKIQDMENIFINLEDILNVHRYFLEDLKNLISVNTSQNLYQVFIKYKERFLLYGRYCSQVEFATKHLDQTACTREDLRMKLEECSTRANNGRFTLRDLLMVPMQRVLKYPLLLQELAKHTTDATEKDNLRLALDAMRDLAQCINEVKRDNETLKQITHFQLSIENLNESLAHYGRPKIDGELKITSAEKRSKMDRYAFLLDKAVLLCKRKGESFELKDFINLQNYQIRDDSSGEKESKKWTHMFLLIENHRTQGYELFFKTRDLKKKWMEQFEMALSNIYPDNSTANGHDFQMFSFEDTASCKTCQMLLRGLFFQGYRCSRCKAPAHKECLGRVSTCGRHIQDKYSRGEDFGSSAMKKKPTRNAHSKPNNSGLTKMEVCQDYYGLPPPPVAFGPALRLNVGEIVELTKAEAEQHWWEGRNASTNEVGCFPCNKVKPYVSIPLPDLSQYSWYAGPLERREAEETLNSRSEGTFLVRQRVKDAEEFAISMKFNLEIKHIKITTLEGLYRITEKKAFKGLIELVEFYEHNSLKDCFKSLDTALLFPFKEPEKRTLFKSAEGNVRCFGSAKARYDFCARDRTELSLKEGDIIKILNKKGHQGWWKGEVYGKIGWFPANYVEEDYSEYC
ncbi:proto-oncogene vav isoform X3 [Rhinatrema bivittatum]|uniref:proto-oncogene vav isoform X3 n=1 Tax=Rhinatrema bivittatum TaxID=194408 RepID=UPI00112E6C0B|nr:proto-oncogene vav isoform X3 [Rhinatrema bivittatum]